jgi:hypothetical protein
VPIILVRILSALLCFSISACSSLQVLPHWNSTLPAGSSDQFQRLRVDDEVLITTVSAKQVAMVIERIEPDALVGHEDNWKRYFSRKDQTVRIQFDDIAQVERREFSWVKTVLLVTGLLMLSFYESSPGSDFPQFSGAAPP